MPNKNYTFTGPDGTTTLSIPAWAQEETLQKTLAALDLAHSNIKDLKRLFKEIEDGALDAKGAIRQIATNVNKGNANQKDFDMAGSARKITNHFDQAVGNLQNTKQPFSAMWNLVKQGGDALGDVGGAFMGTFTKKLPALMGEKGKALAMKLSSWTDNADGIASAMSGALGTYIGLNIAKMEQFNEAQQKLISAGAFMSSQIITEGGKTRDTFSEVRARLTKANTSYDEWVDAVGKYGKAMAAYGGSTTAGALKFVNVLENVEKLGQAVGDYGMKPGELADATGAFLDQLRMSGLSKLYANKSAEELAFAFDDYMIETQALANLTGENVDTIRNRRLEIADQYSGILNMIAGADAGLAERTNGVMDFFSANLGAFGPEVGNAFLNLFTSRVAGGDDFAARHATESLQLINSLEAMSPELKPLVGMLDEAVVIAKNGTEADIEAFGNRLQTVLKTMDAESIQRDFLSKYTQEVIAQNPLLSAINSFSTQLIQSQKNMGAKAEGKTSVTDEKSAVIKALESAAPITSSLNDARGKLLEIQDMLTADFDTSAKMARYMIGGMDTLISAFRDNTSVLQTKINFEKLQPLFEKLDSGDMTELNDRDMETLLADFGINKNDGEESYEAAVHAVWERIDDNYMSNYMHREGALPVAWVKGMAEHKKKLEEAEAKADRAELLEAQTPQRQQIQDTIDAIAALEASMPDVRQMTEDEREHYEDVMEEIQELKESVKARTRELDNEWWFTDHRLVGLEKSLKALIEESNKISASLPKPDEITAALEDNQNKRVLIPESMKDEWHSLREQLQTEWADERKAIAELNGESYDEMDYDSDKTEHYYQASRDAIDMLKEKYGEFFTTQREVLDGIFEELQKGREEGIRVDWDALTSDQQSVWGSWENYLKKQLEHNESIDTEAATKQYKESYDSGKTEPAPSAPKPQDTTSSTWYKPWTWFGDDSEKEEPTQESEGNSQTSIQINPATPTGSNQETLDKPQEVSNNVSYPNNDNQYASLDPALLTQQSIADILTQQNQEASAALHEMSVATSEIVKSVGKVNTELSRHYSTTETLNRRRDLA